MAYKHTIGFELRTVNNMLHRQIIASENIKRVDELTGATGWLIGYLVHNRDRDIFQKDIEKNFLSAVRQPQRLYLLWKKRDLSSVNPYHMMQDLKAGFN